MRNALIRTSLMGGLMLLVAGFIGIAAAQEVPGTFSETLRPHEHDPDEGLDTNSPQPAGPQAMMQMQAQMLERMRTADAHLMALVAKVKSAQGQDAKVDAIADLLAALVTQQTSMHSEMMQLHASMMKQMSDGSMQRMMMEHMQKMMGGMDKMKPQPNQPAAPSPEPPKP